MRLGKTALYHFATQVVISLSGFTATFFIGVIGGSADLGLYTYVVAIGFFWLAIPINGVSLAIKKRLSEGGQQREYFGAAVLINAGLALSLGALVLMVGWILDAVGAPDLVLVIVLVEYNFEVAALLVGAAMLQTTRAGLEGQKRVAYSGGVQAFERVLRSSLQIVTVVLGFGVAAISIGHAASLVIVSIIGLWVLSLRPSLPAWTHLVSVWNYAKYSWIGALRGRVYGWMDTLMLGIFLSGTAGASLIGVYEVAWGLGSLLATLSGSISSTLFPEMSELSYKGDFERVAHFLDEALAFSGLIVIPGLIGAIVIGERVLLFYRPEYVQGLSVLIILVGAYVADVFASQMLNAINAVDRPDAAMRVNIAFIVTNIVLNVILIWQIGWVGAAIATATSASVRVVYGYYVVRETIDTVSIPLRQIGAQFLAAIAMGVLVLVVSRMVPEGRFWVLSLVSFGAIVYFAALLAISGRMRSKTLSLLPAAT